MENKMKKRFYKTFQDGLLDLELQGHPLKSAKKMLFPMDGGFMTLKGMNRAQKRKIMRGKV